MEPETLMMIWFFFAFAAILSLIGIPSKAIGLGYLMAGVGGYIYGYVKDRKVKRSNKKSSS